MMRTKGGQLSRAGQRPVTWAGHPCVARAAHYHYTNIVKRPDGHFRTVGLSLEIPALRLCCAQRGGGKTNRSTCIKRSSRDCAGPKLSGPSGTLGILRPPRTSSNSSRFFFFFFLFFSSGGIFSSSFFSLFFLGLVASVWSTFEAREAREAMQAQYARRVLAVWLALFGYLGDAHAGALPVNSNAIKNLPGVFGSRGADTVSPSPRTSPSSGHKFADTLQVRAARESQTGPLLETPLSSCVCVCVCFQLTGVCTDDEDCAGDEFCNDARGACLPCRRSRKRCTRDAMCCAGNRCSNGKREQIHPIGNSCCLCPFTQRSPAPLTSEQSVLFLFSGWTSSEKDSL